MPKKKKVEDPLIDDLEESIDIENEISMEIIETEESVESIEDEIIEVDNSDDDEIVIKVDDDDLIFDIKDDIEEIDEEIEDKEEIDEDIILSKHSVEGKHSLKYDSIFKGKKEETPDNDDFDLMAFNEKFEVDKASQYWFESIDNENYIKEKIVKEKVYEILSKHTDINFINNRRKPSRVDFNKYYHLLKTHLKKEKFTNIELFNELSVYFSDNLFNMFKLLDNKWRNLIINELQDHIGKKNYSNEVAQRNIHKGTEIEFESQGNDNKLKLITGVVIEVNYETFEYTVDSYENIYIVIIEDITKILNNSKFKYNLNKLNNIDFL
jgi:hypothetical protein